MAVIIENRKIDPETGEILQLSARRTGSSLKDGWIVFYKEPLRKLLKEVPNFATMKVYLTIASFQEFDKVTTITTPYIAEYLGMSYQTAWNAIKWLRQNAYVALADKNGTKGFVVNPFVSTCGKKGLIEKSEAFAEATENANSSVSESLNDNVVINEKFEDDSEEDTDQSVQYGDFPIKGVRLI